MDMSQYLEIFIEEAKEHLQGLNQSLLQLEKDPGDSATLNEIFRVAHTLKGMSGTMGFNKMAKLTHDMEDVLQAIRNNEVKVNTNLIDVLFKCLDALESYVDSVVNTSGEGNAEYNDIIQALNGIIKGGGSDAKAAQPDASEKAALAVDVAGVSDLKITQFEQNAINKAKDMGLNVFQISVFLNKGCLLKSARAFIIFQTLERYGEIIKSQPSVQDIEDEKFEFEFSVVVISKHDDKLFDKELNSISEIENIVIKPLEAAAVEDSGTAANASQNSAAGAKTAGAEAAQAEEEVAAVKTVSASKAKTGKTVRVDIERLDVLMNLVSELIITKTKLEGLEEIESSQKFNDEVDTLERITTNLHDAVMKVRMVPVETVFNRFPRMVRDISRELGKDIELVMSGEETELDRTVIDEIGDPLIHLLRNSADHGIETTEKRKAAGKPDVGHIYLRAYQSGNNVIIEVEDDGDGINIEKVKKKIIDSGLVSKDVANNLSKKDIIDFLFRPSFSTADKITDISGRGVGLDVVKTKIESLNGSVEVETEQGKGSRFIIRLPLTLAIYQALLVVIGSEKYAIPLSSIQQILKIKQDDVKYVQKQEVILLRNMVVPIVRLHTVLDITDEQAEQKQLTAVIVRKGEKLTGLVVDGVLGQREIVIKTLGKLLSGNKLIAGATILGDGNVALILDINSLA